jgi:hypothetical protein
MTSDLVAQSTSAAREIEAGLRRIRVRYRNTVILTAAATALSVILGWLCISASLDYLFMLQRSLRGLLLVLTLGGLAVIGWRLIICRLGAAALKDDAVALMIERALPAFRSRYIAAVQLARGELASKSLVRALLSETAALARTQPFHAVVEKGGLRIAGRLLALLLAIAGSLAWTAGDKLPPLVRRALLGNEPVPRRTKIELLFKQRILAVGDDLLIKVKAGGMIPRGGQAQLAYSGGRKQEILLTADENDRTQFSRLVRSVQEPFDLTILLGDARTESIRMRVKPRPAVLGIDATEILPPYTNRPPERRSVTSLKLLAGSKLALRVKANTPLSHGAIVLYGLDREHPLTEAALAPQKKDATVGEGEIPIPASNLNGFGLRLSDEDGVESRSTTIYPIEVVPDRPPEIKLITPPRREELLTAGAPLLLGFEAKDDFGIARAVLHYAVDWTEGAKDQVVEFELGGVRPRELVRRFEWKIGELRPAIREGQVIDYWIELIDANTVTGPGVTKLEHHQVRIVTPLEKRAELSARLSDAMQGLGETRENQERLNKSLGEFIFAKPGGTP